MSNNLLICGTGNLAHVLAGLGGTQAEQFDVKVFTKTPQKALDWQALLEDHPLTVTTDDEDGEHFVTSTDNIVVTNDVELAARDCDMVILSIPAFAHASYLQTLAPFLPAGVVIVGLPGQNGFEYEVQDIMGATPAVIVNFDSSPWACTTENLGRKVHIHSSKSMMVGALRGNLATARVAQPFLAIRNLIGSFTEVVESSSLLAISLISPNACSHPPIMYGKWRDWAGQPQAQTPLFYHSIDQFTAELITHLSDEVLNISRAIMAKHPEHDLSQVVSMLDWDRTRYGHMIADSSTQLTAMHTNRTYRTSKHPMFQTDKGYSPDFSHRFLAEDIPCGLAVIRGVAELAEVATPFIDEVLLWGQDKLGKEYLLNGQLQGKHVMETRAPQRYGYHRLEDIL